MQKSLIIMGNIFITGKRNIQMLFCLKTKPGFGYRRENADRSSGSLALSANAPSP